MGNVILPNLDLLIERAFCKDGRNLTGNSYIQAMVAVRDALRKNDSPGVWDNLLGDATCAGHYPIVSNRLAHFVRPGEIWHTLEEKHYLNKHWIGLRHLDRFEGAALQAIGVIVGEGKLRALAIENGDSNIGPIYELGANHFFLPDSTSSTRQSYPFILIEGAPSLVRLTPEPN